MADCIIYPLLSEKLITCLYNTVGEGTGKKDIFYVTSDYENKNSNNNIAAATAAI